MTVSQPPKSVVKGQRVSTGLQSSPYGDGEEFTFNYGKWFPGGEMCVPEISRDITLLHRVTSRDVHNIAEELAFHAALGALRPWIMPVETPGVCPSLSHDKLLHSTLLQDTLLHGILLHSNLLHSTLHDTLKENLTTAFHGAFSVFPMPQRNLFLYLASLAKWESRSTIVTLAQLAFCALRVPVTTGIV